MSEARKRLMDRIDELRGYDEDYDEDADLIVSLDLFFDGNEDEGSIGCNLNPHPGVRTFERVLRSIAARPEVSDVVLEIGEVLEDEDEWPFVPTAYVITSAPAQTVIGWAAELEPDPFPHSEPEIAYREDDEPVAAMPAVPPGHRIVVLNWD